MGKEEIATHFLDVLDMADNRTGYRWPRISNIVKGQNGVVLAFYMVNPQMRIRLANRGRFWVCKRYVSALNMHWEAVETVR